MRRRGHISEVEPGHWLVVLSVRQADGTRTRPRYHVRGARADADRELVRLLRQIDTGQYIPPTELTVADMWELWLRDHCTPHLAPRTTYSYTGQWQRYIAPAIGGVRLHKLQPVHVQRLLNDLSAQGLAARTVVQVAAILHKMFRDACRWDLMQRNPAEHVTRPTTDRVEFRTLSPDELARLFAASEGLACDIAIKLAAYTAARRGEVCGLLWQDVDMDAGEITIRRSLSREGGHLRLKTTKTGARTTIPIIAPLREALLQQRARQAEWKLLAGRSWLGDYVCSWEDGLPLDPDYVSHKFAEVRKSVGLPRVRFHDVRHTLATALLEQGVPLVMVSRWLGHSTIHVTANTYSHVTEKLRAQAGAALAQWFGTEDVG